MPIYRIKMTLSAKTETRRLRKAHEMALSAIDSYTYCNGFDLITNNNLKEAELAAEFELWDFVYDKACEIALTQVEMKGEIVNIDIQPYSCQYVIYTETGDYKAEFQDDIDLLE